MSDYTFTRRANRAMLPYRPVPLVDGSPTLLARHPTKTVESTFRCALHSKLPLQHSPGCACSVTHVLVEKPISEWSREERVAYFAFTKLHPIARAGGYKPRRKGTHKSLP